MPSQYTGDPVATEAPSPAPSLGTDTGGDPIGNLPTDGDTKNVSSVIQMAKVPLDWIAFFRRVLSPYAGVRRWNGTTSYVVDDVVVGSDHNLYIARGTSTNLNPTNVANQPTPWEACALSVSQVLAFSDCASVSTAGVSCSNGATCASLIGKYFTGGDVKELTLQITGIPANGSTVVDLTGATRNFASSCSGGIAGLNRVDAYGPTYGGTVGVTINYSADKNKLLIWNKLDASDPAESVAVTVTLIGE